jgi:hypothetical protein
VVNVRDGVNGRGFPSRRTGAPPAQAMAGAAYAYEAYSGEYICDCT